MDFVFVTFRYDGKPIDLCVPERGALGQALPPDHPAWTTHPAEVAKERSFSTGETIILLSNLRSLLKATTPKETFDMSAPIMQTITQYRGRNIKELSPETILDAIRADKKEIKGLQEVGVESAHIAARIAKLEAGIASLVTELDSRG